MYTLVEHRPINIKANRYYAPGRKSSNPRVAVSTLSALLYTCRQFRNEASAVNYASKIFLIEPNQGEVDFQRRTSIVGAPVSQNVRSLKFRCRLRRDWRWDDTQSTVNAMVRVSTTADEKLNVMFGHGLQRECTCTLVQQLLRMQVEKKTEHSGKQLEATSEAYLAATLLENTLLPLLLEMREQKGTCSECGLMVYIACKDTTVLQFVCAGNLRCPLCRETVMILQGFSSMSVNARNILVSQLNICE